MWLTGNGSVIGRRVCQAYSCLMPWNAKNQERSYLGHGIGCSQRPISLTIRAPVFGDGTMPTNRAFNAPSKEGC